jgi:hypothetical protein
MTPGSGHHEKEHISEAWLDLVFFLGRVFTPTTLPSMEKGLAALLPSWHNGTDSKQVQLPNALCLCRIQPSQESIYSLCKMCTERIDGTSKYACGVSETLTRDIGQGLV